MCTLAMMWITTVLFVTLFQQMMFKVVFIVPSQRYLFVWKRLNYTHERPSQLNKSVLFFLNKMKFFYWRIKHDLFIIDVDRSSRRIVWKKWNNKESYETCLMIVKECSLNFFLPFAWLNPSMMDYRNWIQDDWSLISTYLIHNYHNNHWE